ncbi:hypothetical protein D1605_008605 [Xylella fastidiosa subsp. fastidiosa]|uniref:hypothetical protein n=1 Tax=Xylella fastidiosa TaxID=2371 RepID=UPI000F86CB61|nr:hypothetical protein [Xylella fastidiosa]MBE0279472.1 hypothetical protein [Xylella fastidiosa subsp. fastidiosa]MBE0284463.1 hypothetical protein [Xylella fastidiosa subsp. fastidiosa]MBE0293373.1 hypothetical protein [Xylella fastidiosa subsp. fastidiosa]NBI39370.1 hypothetical protein [Xylella fastidiosa subsp. fastidiosa]QGJ38239.2 hypothetical protein FG899_09045 [Xylella fastidiosa subsp. fastidiosa]
MAPPAHASRACSLGPRPHTPEHAPSAASSGRLAEPPVCPGQGRNPSNQAACSRWRVVCGFWLRSGRSAA